MATELYKRTSTGAIQVWYQEVNEAGDGFRTVSGQIDGKHVTSEWTICTGKNVGRANETTPQQQATLEVVANYKKKLESGYFKHIDEIDEETFFKPMLAKDYNDYPIKSWDGVYSQPKLDGCFHGQTLIDTDQGKLKIADIVDQKLRVKVKSLNEVTGEIEWKPIVNWFANGQATQQEWVDVRPELGRFVKTTWNHEFLTQRGWVSVSDLTSQDTLYFDKGETVRRSLLIGGMMGDGHIAFDNRAGNSQRFAMGCCNSEYFEHKRSLLEVGKTYEGVSGYGSKRWSLSVGVTNTGIPFDVFYYTDPTKDTYGKRKLVSGEDLRKYIDDLALAVWCFDDGSIASNNGNSHTPVFNLSVHRYTDDQIEEFIKFFDIKHNLQPTKIIDKRVNREHGQSGAFLKFETKDTLVLCNLLRRHAFRGMEYKTYFPVETYVQKDASFEFVSYDLRRARNMAPSMKYDIEVADNHNYFANDFCVHNCRAIVNRKGMWSRNGKPIVSAPHIFEALLPAFNTDPSLVFDGELYNHAYRDDFNQIVSLAKRSKPTKEDLDESREKLQYWIYDFPDSDGDRSFSLRNYLLSDALNTYVTADFIQWVVTESVHDQADLDVLYEFYAEQGFEGQMVRLDGPYENKRSKYLLKRKEFIDSEYVITAITEGEGNRSGMVGYVSLALPDGRTFDSNIKGDRDHLRAVLARRDELIGKEATVTHFKLTPAGVPRFPVVKVIHETARM